MKENEYAPSAGPAATRQAGRSGPSFRQEWLLFAAASVALGAMFAYMVHFRHAVITDREQDRLVQAASVAGIMIGVQLDKIGRTLDGIRASLGPDLTSDDASVRFVQDRLDILGSAMTSVRTLAVLDAQGNVIASNQAQLMGQSFAHRDYFRLPASDPRPEILHVSPPFETTSGVWLIAVTKAVARADGSLAGVVMISLDPGEFRIILGAVRNTPQTWAALVHGGGTTFVWEPDGQQPVGLNLARPGTFFRQHLDSGRESSFFTGTTRANGERSLLALQTVQPAALHMSTPIVIGVGSNFDAFYADWVAYAVGHLVVYVLVIAFGGVVLRLTQRARRASFLEAEWAEAKLLERSAELSSFFEISPNFLAIVDMGGASRKLNPAWERGMGYTADDFRDMSFFDFFHAEDMDALTMAIEELRLGGRAKNLVARFRNRDGHFRHLEWSLASRHETIFVAAQDVTDRVAEETRLQLMAYHDRLTGLPNRVLFFDRVRQVLAAARRGRKKAAVMFIDLDGFKDINDTLGHDAGDKVLQAVAQRLVRLVRKADTVARLGGDEFVVLLHEVASGEDAASVARKVLEAVGEEIPLGRAGMARVGASIGIGVWPDSGTSVDDVLMAADMAMYQSKKKGKNRFTLALEDCSGHDGVCFGDSYLVGIDVIDAQHLELADAVSKLCKALREGQTQSAVLELFEELKSCTEHHFATEHGLMVRHAFPGRAVHDERHRSLLRELRDMKPELAAEGALFLTDKLRHWLLEHILEQDKALGEFLNGLGGTAPGPHTGSAPDRP
jgi:diguanylate cyclase (GGDEF)-like protein/hemerythrin-like metal-binding protein/PAS domain S-box-containing protein